MNRYVRRLQAIEAAMGTGWHELALDGHMESPETKAMISAAALKYGVTVEGLTQEYRACLTRQLEVGVDNYLDEQSEATGIPLETLRNPVKLEALAKQYAEEYDAWEAEREAEEAQRITWRAGVRYRGSVPDTAA